MEYSFIILTGESAEASGACSNALMKLAQADERGEVIAVEADPAAPGAAINRAASRARGAVLVFVRDIVPAAPDFVRPLLDAFAATDAGVAGGVLLSPAGAVEEAGLIFRAARLSLRGFSMYRQARVVEFCDAVSMRCFATPRTLFDELGGFDEGLGETYAAVDYALRARELGRRSIVLPASTYVRTEPALAPLFATQESDQRIFAGRWRGRAFPLENSWCERDGYVVREDFTATGIGLVLVPLFPATIIDNMAAARVATECRGEGYLVFVRGGTQLEPDSLSHLIDAVESGIDTVAVGRADGTTIVAPRLIPQHLRLREDLELADAVRDWIARAEALGRAVRRETRRAAAQPVAIAGTEPGLTSIVTLSWNAPEYTEVAIASIREHTRAPYEIIVVDNGSRPDTVQRIAALPDVRVIYNLKNTGFAHGTNQGMAAARGRHIVVLNNDVIVTKGWLEVLLDVQRRRPTVGVSSPRSNSVVGSQQLDDALYDSIPEMHAYAARRRREYRGRRESVSASTVA
jgi:GT2 family glycosyltransferase